MIPTPLFLILLGALVAVAGCQRKAAIQPPTVEASLEPTPEPMKAIVAATPEPTPIVVATLPPTPEPNYFAPEGTFYLLSRVSVNTDDGIVGLRPGTRVVLQPDGKYQADGHLLDIQADLLTNDLRVAAQIVHMDQSTQAAIRQALAQQTPPPIKMQDESPRVRSLPVAESRRRMPAEPEYVAGVATQPTGLQTSTTLGAAHSKVADGIVWQKSPDGAWWVPVKRTNGEALGRPTPNYRAAR